mmetsp:Transcript_123841/g.246395  ORF Transcript_123841/g.246395 Transcript_123841/m.246395 type:complete len:284 (+) Transcript_123841:4552-5403(+)
MPGSGSLVAIRLRPPVTSIAHASILRHTSTSSSAEAPFAGAEALREPFWAGPCLSRDFEFAAAFALPFAATLPLVTFWRGTSTGWTQHSRLYRASASCADAPTTSRSTTVLSPAGCAPSCAGLLDPQAAADVALFGGACAKAHSSSASVDRQTNTAGCGCARAEADRFAFGCVPASVSGGCRVCLPLGDGACGGWCCPSRRRVLSVPRPGAAGNSTLETRGWRFWLIDRPRCCVESPTPGNLGNESRLGSRTLPFTASAPSLPVLAQRRADIAMGSSHAPPVH